MPPPRTPSASLIELRVQTSTLLGRIYKGLHRQVPRVPPRPHYPGRHPWLAEAVINSVPRNNDLRQGNTWTVDTLIQLVEDHIRHVNKEPVKTFSSVFKKQKEQRVLNRLNNPRNAAAATTVKTTIPSRGPRTPKPVGMCDHCNKEHHLNLVPEHIKKKRAATATAAARTNVSTADNNDSGDSYTHHIFALNASFISLSILKKVVNDVSYKQRFCYDTAANRHVFNDRSKFTNLVYTADNNAPFKRKGAWYHSGKDKLYTSSNDELAYLLEIDGIPNFLVVSNSSEAPAALCYASLHSYRSSANKPLATRSADDWHHIYSHANLDILKRTAKAVKGMVLSSNNLKDCPPCGLSKSKQVLSRRPQDVPTTLLSIVHVDIVGPIATEGRDGERY
ncbi:hypothetical protein CC86DRAFT_388731 [Ophiobolus disseminans]|uniref:GAG-pre-integrase domain-containing protein n=1 Tax=Ophiobolus disseminans TaxID=1469910 RepID=A0A6A6ZC65_9PLEO|nr:hypothetical protein CC86DRAFT_388731 [Ophiobolus disseminans]